MTDLEDTVEMLTPLALSRFLAVPEATLADWRYKSTGPAFHKLGGLVRYHPDDVAAWLAATRLPA